MISQLMSIGRLLRIAAATAEIEEGDEAIKIARLLYHLFGPMIMVECVASIGSHLGFGVHHLQVGFVDPTLNDMGRQTLHLRQTRLVDPLGIISRQTCLAIISHQTDSTQ